jgi:hypothetical protein
MTSSVLDGGGGGPVGPVVVVTTTVTRAVLRGLGITNGTGGGILNTGRLTLTNVAIAGNRSSAGGGALLNHGVATLTRCRIQGNTTTGVGLVGGAIVNTDGRQVTLVGCHLTGNTGERGGALWNIRGHATLDDCRLSGNQAADGGAINNWDGQLTLRNGTVVGGPTPAGANRAVRGGGISTSGSVVLDASVVLGNVATGSAGAGGIELVEAAPAPIFANGSRVQANAPCDCNFAHGGCGTTCPA